MRLDDVPPPPRPSGAYRPLILIGDMAYLAGFGPRTAEGTPLVGRVGVDLDIESAQAAARDVGLTILSVLQDHLGDLDRIRQVVRITGMVAAPPDFTQHPKIIDGCSLLLTETLGERGQHARMSYGVSSLPNGSPVAIEALVQVWL